jgi:hypothetical protein
MKFVLKKPIQLGEGPVVTELNLREEIVAGDLRGIKIASLADMQTEDLLKITGRLCGQVDALMTKLDIGDFFKLVEIVGGFLARGLGTGTEP